GAIPYSTTSAGCTVNATTGAVTFTSLASCVIKATAAAHGTYAAGSATLTITVTGQTATVIFTGTGVSGSGSAYSVSAPASGYTATAGDNSGGAITYSTTPGG